MKASTLEPTFVEYMPRELQQGTLYISMQYAVAIHLCACGCKEKVVTPLTPADWRIVFEGTVTLHPSIGNWQFPCRSHYMIRSNKIIWAKRWSREQVEVGIQRDHDERHAHFNSTTTSTGPIIIRALQRLVIRFRRR